MADYFEWADSYSVGIQAFDDSHKRLIAITNDLVGSCIEHKPLDCIHAHIIEMIRYTHYHFREEEDMLKATGYNGFELHRETHDDLFNKLLLFTGSILIHKIDGVSISEFLIDWLLTHILESDMAYKEHFSKLGLH